MSTRISDVTRFKQGRGKGTGKDYVPWIKVREVPSVGRSHRILSSKTHRIHHLFSDLEYKVFNVLNYSPLVSDVREQYPLSLSETISIANECNVNHPYIIKNSKRHYVVMTTDFLVSSNNYNVEALTAICVKPVDKLNDQRVREKIEIERRYWRKLDIDFRVVTNAQISPILASNLHLLSEHQIYRGSGPVEEFISLFFRHDIKEVSIDTTLIHIAFQLQIAPVEARKIFLHLLYVRVITFNLERKFSWDLCSQNFTCNKDQYAF